MTLPKFYRMKNPITNLYYQATGCVVSEVKQDQAPVYTEERVNEILHDANVMATLLANHLNHDPFPGYQLEEVSIGDIPLTDKQMEFVRAYARNRQVSIMEAATKYRLQLVNGWVAASHNGLEDLFKHEPTK